MRSDAEHVLYRMGYGPEDGKESLPEGVTAEDFLFEVTDGAVDYRPPPPPEPEAPKKRGKK